MAFQAELLLRYVLLSVDVSIVGIVYCPLGYFIQVRCLLFINS